MHRLFHLILVKSIVVGAMLVGIGPAQAQTQVHASNDAMIALLLTEYAKVDVALRDQVVQQFAEAATRGAAPEQCLRNLINDVHGYSSRSNDLQTMSLAIDFNSRVSIHLFRIYNQQLARTSPGGTTPPISQPPVTAPPAAVQPPVVAAPPVIAYPPQYTPPPISSEPGQTPEYLRNQSAGRSPAARSCRGCGGNGVRQCLQCRGTGTEDYSSYGNRHNGTQGPVRRCESCRGSGWHNCKVCK